MELRTRWKVQLQRESGHVACSSICFKRNHSQLIAAAANDLFFIDTESGEIVDRKRVHQAHVYAVRCAFDGSLFASADSEGMVIVWRASSNEAIVNYTGGSSARYLAWCPTKRLLVSVRTMEYNMWRPEEQRATRTQVRERIEGISFAPTGDVFVLSFASGLVQVVSTEQQEIVQTLNYSAMITTLSYVTIDEKDYLVLTDLDCKVSMFRAADKSLVGRNALPFEALCVASLKEPSFFFAFAGIGGKVSLLSAGLSYLCDFQTDSEWIWDVDVDNRGRIALATREGFVELTNIDFGMAFAVCGDVVAYRTSINAMSCCNIATKRSVELMFVKVIISMAMSSKFLLIHFSDSIVIYRYEETDESIKLERLRETSGKFDKTVFAISNTEIFGATDATLTVLDMACRSRCAFSFQTNITSVSTVPGGNSAIVSCCDGCVYHVVLDQRDPVLLISHSSPVRSALKCGLIVTVLDEQQKAVLYDTFTKRQIKSYDNVASFAFSDRIEDLCVLSDGSSLSIHYKNCAPCRFFVEGLILGFLRNKIVVSNNGALDIIDAPLPLEELIETENWRDVTPLMELGLTDEQWRLISVEASKTRNFDIAAVAAAHVDTVLSLFISEFAPEIAIDKWTVEIESFLGIVKHIELITEDGSEAGKANELEAAGVTEEALEVYASLGDWENVLRLAKERHMERRLITFDIPLEFAEQAAKLLLDAGLGDGAVRILAKTKDIMSLARVHVFLGQWPEAISLSRLNASVYDLIYPKFGQLLFESGQWFEALVCLFIPQNREVRNKTLETLFHVAADSGACDKLAFVQLMLGFNDPASYWRIHQQVMCYYAAHRLKQYAMTPISREDALTVFYLAYYVMGCVRCSPMRSLPLTTILILLLTASSLLGFKRWISYALKELSSYDTSETSRHVIQRCVKVSKEMRDQSAASVICPRCGKNLYESSRIPILVCGFCSLPIQFSAFSCKALPLIPIESHLENSLDLVLVEPTTNAQPPELPPDGATEDYLRNTPPECFIIQKLKDKSNVPMRLYYNRDQNQIITCGTCGSLFTQDDYENSVLDSESCPICATPYINDSTDMRVEFHSKILEMLRTFEPDSPVCF